MKTKILRPCVIGEKHTGWFHGWGNESEIIPPSIMVGGHGGGVVSETYAIVEYQDGTVHRCFVDSVRFTDIDKKEEETPDQGWKTSMLRGFLRGH